jgi:ERCC4-type nuclease
MIFVDNRGSAEQEIATLLSKKNYPVTVQHIDSGDYIIGNLAIERKTIDDLIGSVMSREKGHNFFDQLRVMKDTYKKQLVIIEGFIVWEDRQLAGIIYALVDGWQIPYINTLSKEQTTLRIGQLHDRYGAADTRKAPPPAVRKGYTPAQIRWMMLQTIPHLGGVIAKRIVDKNPFIFADTSKAYDLNIEGLRKDSKDMLLKVLCQ